MEPEDQSNPPLKINLPSEGGSNVPSTAAPMPAPASDSATATATPGEKKPCKHGMSCQFLRAEIADHPLTPKHMAQFIHRPEDTPPEPQKEVKQQMTTFNPPPPPALNEEDILTLMSFGFHRAACITALQQTHGRPDLAADWLFTYHQSVPMDLDEKSGPPPAKKQNQQTGAPGGPPANGGGQQGNGNQGADMPMPPSELHLRRNLSTRAASRAEALRCLIAEHFAGGGGGEETTDEEFMTASFVLPEMDVFTDDFNAWVRRDLIYSTAQAELEQLKILNWSPSPPKLYPLNTNGKGNCLVDACSLSLWGIQDSTMNMLLMRQELYNLLKKHKPLFASRYAGKDLDRLIEEANPEQTKGKGGSLEKLEQLHILGLAHLLGRPIIVYAEAKYRDFQDRIVGDAEGESRMDGVYLPLEPSALFWKDRNGTRPAPICLAFRKFHFSAVVPSASWQLLNLSWAKLPKASVHKKQQSQPGQQAQAPQQQEQETKQTQPSSSSTTTTTTTTATQPQDTTTTTTATTTTKTEAKMEDGKEEKTPGLWYPLVDNDGKEMYVHFLKEGENKQALLDRWFTLVNINGVQGARMPADNLQYNSELLHEYLEKAAENMSALPPETLSDALGKNKPCANRCGRKGVPSAGVCSDCERLPESIKLINTPVGQGATRGIYKTVSYDARGRPMYRKAHGHPFYLFCYWNHQLKQHTWLVCDNMHEPTRPNMSIASEAYNVTCITGVWKYFRGERKPLEDAPNFKIIADEPKPKEFCPELNCSNHMPCPTHSVAPKLARCKNSGTKPDHDFMGSEATQGLCSQCYGESFYGDMVVSGVPDCQSFTAGVYRFHGMKSDDEGEKRPSFKLAKGNHNFYLYFLEGEWSIGEACYGPARNILVPVSGPELPHEVTNKWVYWFHEWVDSDTIKVTQQKKPPA